ncbi:MAG: sugar phosphate isomerase/epimerase family protein [Anaerolineae bacterium]
MPGLALSSMWMYGRFDQLDGFVAAAAGLGFTALELNAAVTSRHLAEAREFPPSTLEIVSVHYPCPPNPKTFDANLATLNRYEREAARQAALDTIGFAADVGAQAVVFHLGRVDLEPALEDALRRAWKNGGNDSRDFRDLHRELLAARARRAPQHLEVAFYDVEFLAEAAQQAGLKIGLETRGRFDEFPMLEEMALLLQEFGHPVYYWHDSGHAQVLENLDFFPHQVWLDAFAGQLLGIHLHDVAGLNDHLAPGVQEGGRVDFDLLREFAGPSVLRVCEVGPQHSRDDLAKSLQMLQAIGLG